MPLRRWKEVGDDGRRGGSEREGRGGNEGLVWQKTGFRYRDGKRGRLELREGMAL